jgi:hypothetical protein
MSRQTSCLVLGLIILVSGSGCVEMVKKCCCSNSARELPPPPPPIPLQSISRGHMEAVFHELPQLLQHDQLPTSAPDQAKAYLALSPKDCQCLAVRCCGVANLMDRERQAVADQANAKCLCLMKKPNVGGAFKQEQLEDAALEARSQQAGGALELYYRLAEAEAACDLLQATIVELDSGVEKAKELKERSLIADEKFEKLLRQRTKVLTDRADLLSNIERLNLELGKLLCIKTCPGELHLWPMVELDSTCCEVNIDSAVKIAVTTRGELKALRAVRRELTLLTLPAARETMKSIQGLLGSADPKAKNPELQILAEMICKEGPYSIELADRRDQLTMRIGEREAAIAADVMIEARQIKRRCETAALAKQRAENLERTVRDVEDRYEKRFVQPNEVTEVRLEWYLARLEVVKEVAARERAKAKLRQHQGVMPIECLEQEPVVETPPETAGCSNGMCTKGGTQ